MKYDVFISYSRKDTTIADQICAAFDKAGITYFIDRQGIVGSGEFPEILADAILESQFFLFLASQNSYSSKYTKKEIHFAFNEKPSGTLFPYLIDDSILPKAIKLVFSDINIRSIKEHPIETVLVDDVLRLLGRTRPKTENTTQPKQEKTIDSTIQTKNEPELKPQKKDGKYGFIDEKGDVVIPFEYDFAGEFYEGLASILIGDWETGKWGFIDKQGSTIIPFEFDKIHYFSEGLAAVKKCDKWGFFDKKGNIVIPFEYDWTCRFSEGLAAVTKNKKTTNPDSVFSWDVGFIDKQGNVVIPFEYGEVLFGGFKNGMCCVCKEDEDHYGFIDKKGNVIIPLIYGSFDCEWSGTELYFDPFHEGLVSAFKGSYLKKNKNGHYVSHGKWGYLDRQGNVIVPFRYIYAGNFHYGKAKVTKKNMLGKEQTFYINKQGNRID